MTRMIGCAVAGLVGFVALITMPGSAISGQELPCRYQGHETVVVDLATGQTTYSGTGESTFAGRFENVGTGQLNLQTMDYHCEGRMIAADGSEIFWVGDGNLAVGGVTFTMTGGTGRFETSSGVLFPGVLTNMVNTYEGSTWTMTFDNNSTGWFSW